MIDRDLYIQQQAAQKTVLHEMLIRSLETELPLHYQIEKNPLDICPGALLRVQADRLQQGVKSIRFFHHANYVSVSGSRILPREEMLSVFADVYTARNIWERDTEFGKNGLISARIIGNDLSATVREIVSKVLTFDPFVRFEWRPCDHDPKGKLNLFDFGVTRLQSIWKSGRQWGTLQGNSFDTKREAIHSAEESARLMLSSLHQERLARLAA
jgi:hypothetical protein